ncbi:hypothetical protein [Halosimplex amylolyticum]|uniref:hypothetical protein n=1 Tax=Halosimplex amylolyticum TaxID=3396616 RepID=UPI003F54A579
MASVKNGRVRSASARTATVLSNLLSVLTLPGVVAHELGHAAVCRLLGVDVETVVLYRWPADFTRDRSGGGYVEHAPAESTWKRVLIGVAPIATNTAASLASLTLAGRLLDTVGPGTTEVSLVAVDAYVSAQLSRLGLGSTLAALALTWFGLSLAFAGFPSRQDLRNVGGFLGRLRGAAGDSRGVTYALEHVHLELSSLYTITVTVVGLFGPRALLTVPSDVVLEFFLIGLVFLGWRVTRGETSWVPDRKRDRLDRVHRLSNRATGGERLDSDEVEFLVETLSEPNQTLREDAALAVRHVAKHHPETLREWGRTVLERAESDRSQTVRRRSIAALFDAYEYVDAERAASVGIEALASEEFDEATHAPPLVTRIARDSPALLTDHLEEISRAAATVSPTQRGNLLYAMSLVATADAANTDRPTEGESAAGAPVRESGDDRHAEVLSSLPEPERGVTERLLRGLDGSTPVRSKAVAGLGVVSGARPETAATLVDLLGPPLEDETAAVRSATLRALSRIAKANPDAVVGLLDEITALLRDEDVEVRRGAARACATLADTDPDGLRSARTDLRDRLDDEDDAVRSSATLALARVADGVPGTFGDSGPDPDPDPFVERLRDDDGDVRANAALALWKLADVAPRRVGASVETVAARLDDPVDSVRANALGVLTAVADERPDLVARHLDDVLSTQREGSRAERVNATSVLATLAEAYPEAVEPSLGAVTPHLDGADDKLRENAVEAVAGVARTRPASVHPVRDTLTSLLSNPDEDVRAAAALALARLARSSPLSVALRVDDVLDATADTDDRVAANARSALLSVSAIDEGGLLDAPVADQSR